MLESRHSGMEIINATTVTKTELTINAQKPNCPSEGYQSSEKINVLNLCVLSKPVDLKTKPVPIASGNSKQNIKHVSIHLEEMLSINLLDKTMMVKNDFIKSNRYLVLLGFIYYYLDIFLSCSLN